MYAHTDIFEDYNCAYEAELNLFKKKMDLDTINEDILPTLRNQRLLGRIPLISPFVGGFPSPWTFDLAMVQIARILTNRATNPQGSKFVHLMPGDQRNLRNLNVRVTKKLRKR